MKKIFYFSALVTLLFILSACGQPDASGSPERVPPALPDSPADSAEPVDGEQAGSAESAPPEFPQELTGQLAEMMTDFTDVRGPAKVIALMKSAGGIIPDDLIRAFLDYHEELCLYTAAPYPDEFFVPDQPYSAANAAKALGVTADEFRDNCYGYWTAEGTLIFNTDTEAFYDALPGRLSRESDEFLTLANMYPSTFFLLNDAGLIKPWDYLAGTMAAYYDYMEAWPDGVHTGAAAREFAWSYQIYIGAIRLDNTPFDNGGSLSPELRQSYESFLAGHEDNYPLAGDIRLLRDAWAAKDDKTDNEIYALIHQLAEQNPFVR